jgi:hypothetical protein
LYAPALIIKGNAGIGSLGRWPLVGTSILHTVALSCGGEAVARFTVTAVAACSVDAFCITLAHWAVLTLINICKQKKI